LLTGIRYVAADVPFLLICPLQRVRELLLLDNENQGSNELQLCETKANKPRNSIQRGVTIVTSDLEKSHSDK
jgi:hypothetical protein